MRRIFGFASLTLLTQLVLLMQQVVLIPVQVRFWGSDTTAQWYSGLALAAITSVADLGLRNSGHAELIGYFRNGDDKSSDEAFRQTWFWIRILVLFATLALVGMECAGTWLYGSSIAIWRLLLILAAGLETSFIIRIVYLDSLGLYNRSEIGYFVYSAVRLAASLSALTVFDFNQTGLALIYFFSALLAIMIQGLTCRRLKLLHLFRGPLQCPSWHALATAKYTVAGPATTWMQLQLPVLVLSAIASPASVMVYVTLRAFFGMVRQSIQTMSRAVSVEYIRLVHEKRGEKAEVILSIVVLFAACLGAWLAFVLIVGGQKILALMAVKVDVSLYRFIAMSFGVSTSFFSYQIMMAIMMRMGKVVEVARRQYGYIIAAEIVCGVGLLAGSPKLYMILAALAECFAAAIFFDFRPSWHTVNTDLAGRRGLPAAITSGLSVVFVWYALKRGGFELPLVLSARSVLESVALVASQACMIASIQLLTNWGLFRDLLFRPHQD